MHILLVFPSIFFANLMHYNETHTFTGDPNCILCKMHLTEKAASVRYGNRFFLLGYQDSNLESQDQNLKCYHYTIAH